MKLNSKGFAITSIIYSMLILFLTLVVLIISNLASRKAVFDKQKEDILDKFEQSALLPVEYQQVEYIESTGTQYILTDVIPDDTTGVLLDFSVSDTQGDTLFFGSRSTQNGRFWDGQTDGNYYYGWNADTPYVLDSEILVDNRFIIEKNYYNDRSNMYDGNLFSSISGTLSVNNHKMAIFAGNDAGTISYYSKIRLYELKITKGSNLVAHFIPSYRKTDGEIGLYDLVEGKFYTNSGTGDFVTADTKASICTYKGTDESAKYSLGAEYECDPGDGVSRTFYLLEVGTNPVENSTLSSTEVALIMDSNIDNTAVKWCKTAEENTCGGNPADGANEALMNKTSGWQNVNVSLPSIYQIAIVNEYWYADGYGSYTIDQSYSWLAENLDADTNTETLKGYWTSTSQNNDSTQAWDVTCDSQYSEYGVIFSDKVSSDTIEIGIRPVIIISKDDLG